MTLLVFEPTTLHLAAKCLYQLCKKRAINNNNINNNNNNNGRSSSSSRSNSDKSDTNVVTFLMVDDESL
jgi:hypothetical protein